MVSNIEPKRTNTKDGQAERGAPGGAFIKIGSIVGFQSMHTEMIRSKLIKKVKRRDNIHLGNALFTCVASL